MILECGCPSEYPDWHDEDVDLGGMPIHVLPIPMVLHMPLAYETYLKKQQEAIFKLQLHERWPGMVLMRTGMFRGRITRLLVDETHSLSSQVKQMPIPYQVRAWLHHGNVSTIRNVVREMQMALIDSGRMPKELHLCYLTCPRCSEERGGEKLLLLRHWQESPVLMSRRRKSDS